MPRRARIAFENHPHHVVQRGHCRRAVFLSDADRSDYLATLVECRNAMGIKLLAYCLMDNHVHLVMDPGNDAASISATMKRLAGRHSRRLNRRNAWSGSIWESRFKCSPIDTDTYLLVCGIYVDLNPVRAGIARLPEHFAWSSYRSRAGLTTCDWLDVDPALQALARTPERRWTRYRELVKAPIGGEQLSRIRESLSRNQLTGGVTFAEKLRRATGVVVSQRPPGRPRKNSAPAGK